MTTCVDEDAKLLELLNRHPELKQRVRALADIAADANGDLVRADEAERRVIGVRPCNDVKSRSMLQLVVMMKHKVQQWRRWSGERVTR